MDSYIDVIKNSSQHKEKIPDGRNSNHKAGHVEAHHKNGLSHCQRRQGQAAGIEVPVDMYTCRELQRDRLGQKTVVWGEMSKILEKKKDYHRGLHVQLLAKNWSCCELRHGSPNGLEIGQCLGQSTWCKPSTAFGPSAMRGPKQL